MSDRTVKTLHQLARDFDAFLESPHPKGGVWVDHVPDELLAAWEPVELYLSHHPDETAGQLIEDWTDEHSEGHDTCPACEWEKRRAAFVARSVEKPPAPETNAGTPAGERRLALGAARREGVGASAPDETKAAVQPCPCCKDTGITPSDRGIIPCPYCRKGSGELMRAHETAGQLIEDWTDEHSEGHDICPACEWEKRRAAFVARSVEKPP